MLNKRWLRGAPFFNGLRMLVTEEDKAEMPPEAAGRGLVTCKLYVIACTLYRVPCTS